MRVNGEIVASTANQHRSYRADIRQLLVDGGNTLTVGFRSALEHAEEMAKDHGRPHVNTHPFNMIRKMACSFGWDWGPDFQTAGIWKPIGIERWRTARIAQVRPLVTVADDGTGRVEVHVEIERSGLGDDDVVLTLRAAVDARDGERASQVTVPAGATRAVVVVDAGEVDLWWPRGYGAPALYDLRVSLGGPAGEALAIVERRIGFRTVALSVAPDEFGTSFVLSVNGTPVFARGANWIPDDHFLTRVDRARYGRRIAQAVDANINLLRVWGGGIYETEDFYDLCDAAGVMVWQDFLFACADYPEEEPLRSEVEAEARENVARLMTHASLVIWNGANENMWQSFAWRTAEQCAEGTWGLGYYEDLLPAIVAEVDPTRPYSANSPYSPGFASRGKDPNDPDHGTHHQWQCWNGRDYVHYRDDIPRFCSEFRWQGPPTWATLPRAVPADALDKGSAAFLLHQKAADGNGKLDRGIGPHLPVPEEFEDWHWAAQLTQARAVRCGIEHHRSWWPRTAGSVVWQFNDCWPVTSWAMVDGDERRMPVWYAMRDAFADRLLTVQPREGRLVVAAVNDTDDAWVGVVVARRTTFGGQVLAEATIELNVPARQIGLLALPDEVLAVADVAREVLVATPVVGPGDDHAAGVREVYTWGRTRTSRSNLRLSMCPSGASTGDTAWESSR